MRDLETDFRVETLLSIKSTADFNHTTIRLRRRLGANTACIKVFADKNAAGFEQVAHVAESCKWIRQVAQQKARTNQLKSSGWKIRLVCARLVKEILRTPSAIAFLLALVVVHD